MSASATRLDTCSSLRSACPLYPHGKTPKRARLAGSSGRAGVTARPRRCQHRLFSRASASSQGPCMIDAAPAATLSLILDPMRARPSMRLIHVPPSRGCRPPRVCQGHICKGPSVAASLIDLVLSYSIDGTVSIFTHSDVLRPSILSTVPTIYYLHSTLIHMFRILLSR